MATALIAACDDRRTEIRRLPRETPWLDTALLRPGQDVVVINLSSQGALLESSRRLCPGARAELQLASLDARRTLRVQVLRCAVTELNPLRYRGAVQFDDRLGVDGAG